METVTLFFHLHLFIHSHNRSGLKIFRHLGLKIKRAYRDLGAPQRPKRLWEGWVGCGSWGSSGEGAGERASCWGAVGGLKGSTLLQVVGGWAGGIS